MNSASASENTTSDGESKEIQSNTPSSVDQTEVAESSSLQVIAPSTPQCPAPLRLQALGQATTTGPPLLPLTMRIGYPTVLVVADTATAI